ncbi:unnamed protein product [Ixodes pacificus]
MVEHWLPSCDCIGTLLLIQFIEKKTSENARIFFFKFSQGPLLTPTQLCLSDQNLFCLNTYLETKTPAKYHYHSSNSVATDAHFSFKKIITWTCVQYFCHLTFLSKRSCHHRAPPKTFKLFCNVAYPCF